MGWLNNRYVTEKKKVEHTSNVATNWTRCTHARCNVQTQTQSLSRFSPLSRCQNVCLGFYGRRRIFIRLNKPKGTEQGFQPSTKDWIIRSDVNHRQKKKRGSNQPNGSDADLPHQSPSLSGSLLLAASDIALPSTVIDTESGWPQSAASPGWSHEDIWTHKSYLLAKRLAMRKLLNRHSN